MMSGVDDFSEVLSGFVQRACYTTGQLAQLSGIPKTTLVGWLQGWTKKPRRRDRVLKVAVALRLTEVEATRLLQAAGCPSVAELQTRANGDAEQHLLSFWAEATPQPVRQIPFQAIADLPYFVGRERELDAVQQVLLESRRVMIYGLQGMGGVGKTALAARLAYRLRAHFPDGVLWARVDTSDSMSILSTFAEAYGRDVSAYSDLDGRSRVVRDILKDKRVLVVLDNVQRDEEVRPLLPPAGAGAVILTTRRHDLSVMNGMQRFDVGPFDVERHEALDLFARLLGDARTSAERAALNELAGMLGHLPLAVAIAAGRLAYEPDWSAAHFLAQLHQERQRLNELAYGDLSVRLSFNLGYDALLPAQRRLFAALGTFGGDAFDAPAVAYVARMSPEELHGHLRQLCALSLVQPDRSDRYRLHPLLRDYAREKIDDGEVFERMVTYFVEYVERHQSDYPRLTAEMGNLLGALQTAFDRNLSAAFVRGANALSAFLNARGRYALAEVYLEQARDIARASGDGLGEATALLNLGTIGWTRRATQRAATYLQDGLAVARRIEHQESISALLALSGMVALAQGDDKQAEAQLLEGLALARFLQRSATDCLLLQGLGEVALHRGENGQAEAYWQEGLALARELGHLPRASVLLNNLGVVAFNRGEYAQAEKYYQAGFDVANRIHYGLLLSALHEGLGAVALKLGDTARAEMHLREGLSLARELGDLWIISPLLNGWGELQLRRQQLDVAAEAFEESLAVARQVDVQTLVAESIYGLAQVATARGDVGAARRHGRESLTLFKGVRHYRAAEVGKWLETLPVEEKPVKE